MQKGLCTHSLDEKWCLGHLGGAAVASEEAIIISAGMSCRRILLLVDTMMDAVTREEAKRYLHCLEIEASNKRQVLIGLWETRDWRFPPVMNNMAARMFAARMK